jgi:hypothetical protein
VGCWNRKQRRFIIRGCAALGEEKRPKGAERLFFIFLVGRPVPFLKTLIFHKEINLIMNQEEIWFRASDGRELCVNQGSTAAILMSHDPTFVRIEEPQGEELSAAYQGPEPVIVDLSWMTTDEQVELARTILGLKSKDQ